jgi:hypothetical protein
MTIKQFQELYFITQSKDTDFDKSVKMVGAITGITPDKVDNMPMPKFNRLCANIQKHLDLLSKKMLTTKPRKLVLIKGRIYRLHYRIDRFPINAGRYVETITFGKDIITNLHKIMASIATPVTWRGKEYERPHEDIATDFESMDFEAAYHAAVFFYTHYTVSMQIIQPYLMRKMLVKGVEKKESEMILHNSQKILDGLTTPKWSQILKVYLLNRFGRSELSNS